MKKVRNVRTGVLGCAAIAAIFVSTITPAYAETGAAEVDGAEQVAPGDPSDEATTPDQWLEQQTDELDVTAPAIVHETIDDDGISLCADDPSIVCTTATTTGDPADTTLPGPAATDRAAASRAAGTADVDVPLDLTISTGCLGQLRSARWNIARWAACSHRGGRLTLVTKEGKRVGTVRYETYHEVTGNPTKGEWSNAFLIRVTGATGIGAATEVVGQGNCIGKCTFTGGTDIVGAMAPGAVLQGEAHFKWRGTAGARVTPRPWWDFNYSHPDGITIDSAGYKAPKIRCDRDYPGRPNSVGCVFPQQSASLDLNDYYNAWATHVIWAQANGLPTVLHRATLAEKNANRAIACASAPKPRPTGYQCDEYPFASAKEGAAAGTGGVRVPDIFYSTPGDFCGMPPAPATGPGGWSICLIPAADNQEGGQVLNNIYKAFRVIPGDAYSLNYSTAS